VRKQRLSNFSKVIHMVSRLSSNLDSLAQSPYFWQLCSTASQNGTGLYQSSLESNFYCSLTSQRPAQSKVRYIHMDPGWCRSPPLLTLSQLLGPGISCEQACWRHGLEEDQWHRHSLLTQSGFFRVSSKVLVNNWLKTYCWLCEKQKKQIHSIYKTLKLRP